MDAITQLEELCDSTGFTSLSLYTKAFDLFRVMGVSSKELVYSNISAAFMNEDEAHGLRASFRDAFAASLAQLTCNWRPIPMRVLAGTKGARAKVSRERAHVDVLLDFPSLRLVSAIEKKILATDQHEQVARYQKTLCDLYPHYESRALV